MASVITYRLEHSPCEVDLCARCAADPGAHLSTVSRGEHRGRCEGAECNDPATDRRALRDPDGIVRTR
jgi:hypothetical protein